MLRTITAHFSAKGHEVAVLTAQPSYKNLDRASNVPSSEILEGVSVKRLSLLPGSRSVAVLRVLSKATWPMRAAIHLVAQSLLGRRQNIIVAATIPPVANGLFGLIAARITGAKFVYHLQDIYPEIGAVGGLWPEGSWKHKLLKWFDTLVCKQADQCIVLSDDMANTLLARGVKDETISVINNFMLASFSDVDQAESQEDLESYEKTHRIVFAGNLGRFQGLELMLGAFLELPVSEVQMELHFIGEGAAQSTLKKMAEGTDSVFFHGHHPFEAACRLMATYDAGIVSIQPEIYRYAYPSKTLTYLGLGLPLLAFVEPESALSRSIGKNQLGVSASNTCQQSLQDGYVAMAEFLQSSANDRQRIKSFAEESTSTIAVMSQWQTMFDELTDEQSGPPQEKSTV